MFEKIKNSLSKIFIPDTKNAMTLPNQFLRYGNRGRLDPSWNDVAMSDVDFYTGYSYAAIRNRANKVARTATQDYLRTESEKEDFIHPYLEIINKSNTFSNYQFWSEVSTFLDLEGIYYLMAIRNFSEDRVGNIVEFKLLSPYNIRRVLKKDSLEVTGYVETRKGLVREISPKMVIEIKELNPFNEDTPFAMTDAARESQFTLKSAGDYTRSALKGNLNSPGILTTDVILPDQEFANFVERVRTRTKGEPIFGNGTGAITWENMTQDLGKAGLEKINEVNRDSLFAVSGVSKTTMGIEQSGVTRDTARVQKEINMEDHILPRIQLIIDALNQDYKNNYPNDYNSNKAEMIIDNPLAVDHEAELKNAELKGKEYETYKTILSDGYDFDLAAKYVSGQIDLEGLGEPEIEEVEEEEVIEDVEADNEFDIERQNLVQQQEGTLKNAIVNVEEQLVIAAINKVPNIKKQTNQFESESDIITKEEKNENIDELIAVLMGFYGIMFTLRGQEVMRDRVGEFALIGQYNFDKKSRDYISKTSKKVAKSHVDTVLDDILLTAREAALEGLSRENIISRIKQKYSKDIVENRAKAVARTETNRAFTRAQYEADRQFIAQNNLEGRVYKKLVVRSDNPCAFCLSTQAQGWIPFNQAFHELGDTLEVDGKKLEIGFETVEAGNLHTNCACSYEIQIRGE